MVINRKLKVGICRIWCTEFCPAIPFNRNTEVAPTTRYKLVSGCTKFIIVAIC
jgi:hypothetical protein